MKIAVPTTENYLVDDYFDHCGVFTVFCISEDNEVMAETMLESSKYYNQSSNIATDLAEMDVKIMLTGAIGDGAVKIFAAKQIEVVKNCSGDVYELIENYLTGGLRN